MTDPIEGLNRKLLDPDEWLRQQDQRIAALRASSEEATAELARANVEASDRAGLVTVTVNPSGVLMSAWFSPRTQGAAPAQLTAALMEAYRTATREASAKMLDIMSNVVGEDTDAMNFLKSTMPDIEEDEPDDGRGSPGGYGYDPYGQGRYRS
ncbi:YbaB/EbfC family nucleoid-associated protein [Phytomonospora sp. NPDC050363]|uniref:YbaB/EbfC family nucleoid-associated protein n=1 Tax=Phytomonospora sp. NPDC050363 TaxID=3155642 RepID=UPI0033DC7849